jgi:D-alanyl-D-alanine carboxypeptidase
MPGARAWAVAAMLLAFAWPVAAADYARRADALVRAYADAGRFSGSVLVARDGKPVFKRSYGLANREWETPAGDDTRYRIGSITKQFTAAAILQLAEAGKLRLDDPVSRHYADAPPAWAAVTIRHLLTHTSGIPSHPSFRGAFAGDARRDWTPEQILGLSRDRPLAFPPGSRFAYSNTGYDLLGVIIERVSGQGYAAYLDQHVIGGAGLTRTRCESVDEVLPQRAAGYLVSQGRGRNAPYVSPSLLYAAGCLVSTTGDLLAWDRALHGGRVVSAASLAEMFRDQGFRYGFGEFIQLDRGHRLWSHGGGLPGFASALNHYPDDALTVVVLANVEPADAGRVANQLGRLLFEPEPARGPQGPPRREELAAYRGRYRWTAAATIEVTAADGRLYAGLAGQPPVALVREMGRTFFMPGLPFQITFADGAPAPSLVLHQDLTDTTAPRIP